MKFFVTISKFIWFVYFLFKYQRSKLATLLSESQISLQSLHRVKRSGDDLVFGRTGNIIPIKNTYVYKKQVKWLIAILNNKKAKVTLEPTVDNVLLSINNGIKVNAQSAANIYIAYETFLAKLYNFSTPYSNNIVIDIGMNVGYTTLFFASLPKTAYVYSYEPFPETYNEAINNINLNPHLKSKIKPFDYGISNQSQVLDVPIFESGDYDASTTKFVLDHKKNLAEREHIKVEVKDIDTVLSEIMALHPQQKIFLKVDCEGEEYGIMERLDSDGMIKNVAGFLIEWHFKGPGPILDILNRNDFTSIDLPKVESVTGMIYSFK